MATSPKMQAWNAPRDEAIVYVSVAVVQGLIAML